MSRLMLVLMLTVSLSGCAALKFWQNNQQKACDASDTAITAMTAAAEDMEKKGQMKEAAEVRKVIGYITVGKAQLCK